MGQHEEGTDAPEPQPLASTRGLAARALPGCPPLLRAAEEGEQSGQRGLGSSELGQHWFLGRGRPWGAGCPGRPGHWWLSVDPSLYFPISENTSARQHAGLPTRSKAAVSCGW